MSLTCARLSNKYKYKNLRVQVMRCNEVDCLEPLCTDFVVHKILIFTIAVNGCWQTNLYEILFIDTDIITLLQFMLRC